MYPKLKVKLNDNSKETILVAICLLCIFLFLYTACSKLIDHHRFFNGLNHVDAFKPLAGVLSWAVPIAEITTAVLLIIPHTYRIGLYLFISLVTLFTGYILGMLLWAKKLPCHCGGVIEKLSWGQHVWFNLAFIAIAIVALRLGSRKNKLP